MSEQQNISEDKSENEISQPAGREGKIENVNKPFPEDSHAPKQATKNMEVHHHGHVHEKKKWKEYLFQFLMLFLAVTAGFFMENQREHYVERQRAKQLVMSMVIDLRKDTLLLTWIQNFRIQQRKPRLDSFHMLLNMPPLKVDKSIYYPLIYNVAEFYRFSQSTGTINQLKNAGYLRYFNDTRLLNYISEYDFLVQELQGDENIEFNLHYDQFMQLVKQNSDNDGLRKVYFEKNPPQGLGIEPIDEKTLKSMKILLTELSWYNDPLMIRLSKNVKDKAVEIINYLNSKYHLDK